VSIPFIGDASHSWQGCQLESYAFVYKTVEMWRIDIVGGRGFLNKAHRKNCT